MWNPVKLIDKKLSYTLLFNVHWKRKWCESAAFYLEEKIREITASQLYFVADFYHLKPLCSGVASFSLAKVWPWWKATLMLVAKLRNLDCNMRNLWSLLVCRRRRHRSWRHRRRFRRRQDDEQWGIRLVVSGPPYGGSWPSSNWWLGFQTALLGDEYCNICC